MFSESSTPTEEDTDPSMTQIQPVSQWKIDYSLVTMETPIGNALISVLKFAIRDVDKDGLLLDEAPISPTWVPILGSEFVGAIINITRGMHRIRHVTGAKFGVVHFGQRYHEAFGCTPPDTVFSDGPVVAPSTEGTPTERITTGVTEDTTSDSSTEHIPVSTLISTPVPLSTTVPTPDSSSTYSPGDTTSSMSGTISSTETTSTGTTGVMTSSVSTETTRFTSQPSTKTFISTGRVNLQSYYHHISSQM